MTCLSKLKRKKQFLRFVPLLTVTYFMLMALFVSNNVAKAAKLSDGTWSQSASPGTTTVTYTNTTALDSSSDIILTFPSTATIDQTGTDISVTGSSGEVRVNNTVDNTITITIDGTIDAGVAVTITMTDALSAYTTTTYAQESLAINTQDSGDTPIDFGVAIMTNDNTTTVTASVPLFVNMAVDDTTIELGTLSTASVSEADQTYTVNSNNQSGITMQIATDGDLDDGSGNEIDALGDTAVSAGVEEYGIEIDNVSSLTIDTTYQTGQDNPIVEAADDLATTAGSVSSGTLDINYKASIDGNTVAGSYDQVVTVTIATNA